MGYHAETELRGLYVEVPIGEMLVPGDVAVTPRGRRGQARHRRRGGTSVPPRGRARRPTFDSLCCCNGWRGTVEAGSGETTAELLRELERSEGVGSAAGTERSEH
jgi:hypothetical protein